MNKMENKRLSNPITVEAEITDKPSLRTVLSTETQLSANSSLQSAQLKQEIRETKELDRKIKKAANELFALEKLEKLKKLSILKQQKDIQLQKIQCNQYEEDMLLNQKPYTTRPEAKISLSEVFKFPNIVKTYKPSSAYKLKSSFTGDIKDVNEDQMNYYDNFYSQNNKMMTKNKNFVSFDEVMRVIDEVEKMEKYEGNYKDSSYFYNGFLIKGTGNTEKRSMSYPPLDGRFQKPSYYEKPSAESKIHEYRRKDFKKIDYLSSGSENTYQSVLRESDRRQSHKSSSGKASGEVKINCESSNRSEFFATPMVEKNSPLRMNNSFSSNKNFSPAMFRQHPSIEGHSRHSSKTNSQGSRLSGILNELRRENDLNRRKDKKNLSNNLNQEIKDEPLVKPTEQPKINNDAKISLPENNIADDKMPEKGKKKILENLKLKLIKTNVNHEEPVKENKLVIFTPVKNKKKTICGRLRKRFGLKNKSKKAIAMEKKGMYCSVYDIDENFNPRDILLPRPQLDEEMLNKLSTLSSASAFPRTKRNQQSYISNTREMLMDKKKQKYSALSSIVLNPVLNNEIKNNSNQFSQSINQTNPMNGFYDYSRV